MQPGVRATGYSDGLRAWGAAAVLVLLVLWAYGPVARFGFVALDDGAYVVENVRVRQGLTWGGLTWAFTAVHAANWHPLTWLSHMLDCEWFGLDAGRHHLTSVAIHAANTLLLFLALRLATRRLWSSAFVAAFFALHPLRVESVAWIAERKDVLSGFFALSTLLAYGLYARRPGLLRYLLVSVSFALGLLAKPMLVTLPGVMLLLDYWPLARLWPSSRSGASASDLASAPPRAPLSRLVLEKLPLAALACASAAVTISSQSRGGATASFEVLPFGTRLANAMVTPLAYLGKTIWPIDLACFYPHPERVSPEALAALFRAAVPSGLVLGVVTVLAIHFGRRWRYLPVGWLSYLGMLVPVIGWIQVGDQAMADRYTYLPLIGVGVATIWGALDLTAARPAARRVLLGVALALVGALTLATRHQVSFWSDSRTLFEHALTATRSNYFAHNSLGTVLQEEGEFQEAETHYRASLEIRPDYPEALNNLGIVLESRGDLEGAERQYRSAIAHRPGFAAGLSNLGNLFARRGDTNRAIQSYERAIEAEPDRAEAHNNLGFVLAGLERDVEAETHLRRALELDPGLPDAQANLALLLTRTGRREEAIPYYRSAVATQPQRLDLANNLAWILATHDGGRAGEHQEALRLAERVAEATDHRHPSVLMTLAAACARAGRFEDAVRWQERVIESSSAEQREELGKRLELYRSGRPYSEGERRLVFLDSF